MNKFYLVAAIASFLFYPSSFVHAKIIDFSGFGTVGAAIIDTPNATYNNINNEIDFTPLSRVGINGVSNLGKNWSLQIQLLGEAVFDDFDVSIEWFKISWTPNSNFRLDIGKQQRLTWLFSEQLDVGIVYPWIRPPQEVYNTAPNKTFLGVSASIMEDLSEDFHGGIQFIAAISDYQFQANNFELNNRAGKPVSYLGATLWAESPSAKFKFGYFYSHFDTILEREIITTAPVVTTINTDFNLGNVHFISAGAQFDFDNLTILTEAALLSASGSVFSKSVSGYLTVGYYLFQRKLLPHLTYAQIFEQESTFIPGGQKSTELGLNYSFDEAVMLKVSWKHVFLKPGEVGRFSVAPNEDVNIFSSTVDIAF